MLDATTEAYVEAVVSAAPPLTDEQKARLASLLRPQTHVSEVER